MIAELLSAAEPPAEPPALLRRRPGHFTQRRVAFFDPLTRELALESAGPLTLDSARASDLLRFLADLPAQERPRSVFICGAAPAVTWWFEPGAYGWRWRWFDRTGRRTAAYTHPEREDLELDLREATPWFGAERDPHACLRSWRSLLRGLRGAFGTETALLTTPALTGRALFEASLPYGTLIPTLPADLRDLLAATNTQGRFELFRPHRQTLDAVYELDARWMYAACLHHLPVGRVQRDTTPAFDGPTPGFYLVKARAPRGWSHIGLLPDLASFDAPGRIRYPSRASHGAFWSWASGAELELALRCGWPLTIHQRILWPETHKLPDVAKVWIDKLRSLREIATQRGGLEAGLVADALRHLVLDTVGAWHSRERSEHGVLPLAQLDEPGALPAGAVPHIETANGQDVVLWERSATISPHLLIHAHPEWSATVWGRARARTAKKALELPSASLIALRNDGVWTSANPWDEALHDEDPRPGAWRVKAAYTAGLLFWPRDEAQLIQLMRQARRGAGAEAAESEAE